LASRCWPAEARDLWGVLELGARQITLTAVVGEIPAYVRNLNGSTEQWTRRIGEGLDVSLVEAERLKRTHGIAFDGVDNETGPNENAHLPAVIFGLLRDRLEVLASEIERCFSYVLRHYPDITPARLVLAGGGAAMAGIPAYLSKRLSIPALVLGGGGGGPFGFHPDTSAAVGAAMMNVEPT
jgi:Tfp pilus assembly PilM family ATPase